MYLSLAWRSLVNDRVRFAAAVCGIAAATGLLCWHVGLAMTAVHSGDYAAGRATAPFCAWVTGPEEGRGPGRGGPDAGPGRGEPGAARRPAPSPDAATAVSASADATRGRRMASRVTPIPPPLMRRLSDAPGVTRTVALSMVTATLDVRPGGRVLQGPPLRANVALLPEGGIPFAVGGVEGRLPDPLSPVPEVAVSRTVFGSRVPAPPLGSQLRMVLSDGTAAPAITAFFDMSGMIQIFPTVYANRAAMDAIAAVSPEFRAVPNLALFATRDGTAAPVEAALRDVPAGRPPCRLYTTAAVAARFRADSVNNLIASMPLSLVLAAIAAACLVATTMLIDIASRRRRIAELRCAGMTRGGVARLMLCETSLVVVAGWLAGCLFAGLALKAFLWFERGGDLPASPHFGWQTPLSGIALAVAVGLAAAAVPVVAAMRVRPLEAIGAGRATVRPVAWRRAALALPLLAPMALVSVWPGLGETAKAAAMGLVGLPCFVAAVFVALHPVMRIAEAVMLAPLSAALGLDKSLLRDRISRDPARAAGTILTIAFCLGGFIAIHVWGGTLMSSFVPSREWPDAIVTVLPNGWDDAQVRAAAKCPGVEGARLLKIDCTQKPIDPDSPAFAGREDDLPRGQILLFGADPDAAFGGDRPFAPFRFVAGDRAAAVAAMREGRGCVIVSMLARMAGLGIGDRIRFSGRELEVAGIVDLNWHMVTSRSQVRTSFGNEGARRGDASPPGRTASMAFVSERFVREITGNSVTYFAWLRMAPELAALGGLQAAVMLDGQLRAAVGDDGASAIQVHHRDEIADGTLSHGNDILGVMARIPFWSLAVASFGMVALLLASVQGNMRELSTMRAVGMTRGQLARLVFGEAMLAAAAAVLLGLVAGIVAGWSFTGLSRWIAAAGLPSRLVVPWITVFKGVAFAFSLCAAMALLPLSRLVRLVDGG